MLGDGRKQPSGASPVAHRKSAILSRKVLHTKRLTRCVGPAIMLGSRDWLGADVAQLAEHLICNQAVASSTLAVSSRTGIEPSDVSEGAWTFRRRGADPVGYPSGQREQTVNLPAHAFEGSNPSPTMVADLTKCEGDNCGSSSVGRAQAFQA